MTASCRHKPILLFLLFFTIAVPQKPTGISSGGNPARAKQRHAVLCQGVSVRGAVRPGTRNEGVGGSQVSQGAAESTVRRPSTRTQEMESPSVGADYHCPRREKRRYLAGRVWDFGCYSATAHRNM